MSFGAFRICSTCSHVSDCRANVAPFVSPVGVLSMCSWYRPGVSSDDVVLSFKDEYLEHASDCIGSIVAGALNFHRIR